MFTLNVVYVHIILILLCDYIVCNICTLLTFLLCIKAFLNINILLLTCFTNK